MHTIGQFAESKGAKYWMYFDQDTRFNDDTVKFINKYVDENSNLGWHNDLCSTFFSQKILKKNRILLPHHSGMLFRLKYLKSIGWHDNSIFLDCLDYDYCLRAKSAGYFIEAVSSVPGIDHVGGQDEKLYPFFGVNFNLSRVYNKKRVVKTLTHSTVLIWRSIYKLEPLLASYLLRFLLFYVFFQCYARIRQTLSNLTEE